MKAAMILTSIALLVALFAASTSAKDQGCGGLLEGENGKFSYDERAVMDGQDQQKCVWLVQAYGAMQIRLTLDELSPAVEDNILTLYPERKPGQTDLNPTTLNGQGVGSTLNFPGSTIIIVLPKSNSSLSYTWESTPAEFLGKNDSVTMADYIQMPKGKLTWTPGRRQEKAWWIIDASAQGVMVEWKTQVDEKGCENCRPCACLSFEAFEIDGNGYLQKIESTCGRSSGGVFQLRSSSPLVVASSASTTELGASKVELHWMGDQGSVTTTSTTTSTTTTTTTTKAPPEILPSIYFTTWQRGFSALSLETNKVKKIADSTEILWGITYDSINDKLYFSTFDRIYKSNTDGSEVEIVLNTNKYGTIWGLAFDWIGGNVYVATHGGILACGAENLRTFISCYTILEGQSFAKGISLDPTEGLMYWTSESSSIKRAGMDGSSPLTLVSGLIYPYGVTIDFASRRLYWAEEFGDKIQSSDLDGRDVQLVVRPPPGSGTCGIAVLNDRIYWGNAGDNKLQSCTKGGQDLRTLYNETHNIYHLAIVPALDRSPTRTNDCEGQSCSTLCVLTPTSYRCLN